jgi:two-component system chemotaxis sensor kinase CheA
MVYEEEIREFLIESNENLAMLDREIVELEQHPEAPQLIASVFRTMHTVKGTCGFFGFSILCGLTHITENILEQVREKIRPATPELISLILEAVDAVRTVLGEIELIGVEGEDIHSDLRRRLEEAFAAAAPPEGNFGIEPEPEAEADVVEDPVAVELTGLFAPYVPAVTKKVVAMKPVETMPAPAAAVEVTGEFDAEEPALQKNQPVQDSSIRVQVGLLDKLMNLVGELVLARNQLLQGSAGRDAALTRTAQRLNLITSELQEGVMKTRMQPIGIVWNKLPRVVRDLAQTCGKKIQIDMIGADTELDKTIIEAIKDPLTHIVRNSCDHGIETPEVRLLRGKPAQGRLVLRAFHEGGHVNIEISDDGAGLDIAKLKVKAVQKGLARAEQVAAMSEREAAHLVFLPGFSTAEHVTNISGRGVGMDVVKTNIEKTGGMVDIYNRPEGGTTVKIKIPLTLAIIPGLVVTLEPVAAEPASDMQQTGQRFVIPQANLVELVRLEGEEDHKRIENVNGSLVYRRRGALLPLIYLNRVLQTGAQAYDAEVVNIVVLQAEDRPFGLIVDGISDTQEIVVKPLGKHLKGLTSYLGATIMGDGRVALILDVAGLARQAGIGAHSRGAGHAADEATVSSTDATQTLLLFRAGRYNRLAVPLALVARLEQFPASQVEQASGHPVLHYRNQILPLVSLAGLLDPDREDVALAADPLQVIVFGQGARSVGVVVAEVLDIVEETVGVSRASTKPGILGSAVSGGKLTDFVDLHALVTSSGEDWMQSPEQHTAERHGVLLVESSGMARGMLASHLAMNGYRMMEAETAQAAVELLNSRRVDLVLFATKQEAGNNVDLMKVLTAQRMMRYLPVMALDSGADEVHEVPGAGLDFDARVSKRDREQMLTTMQALLTAGRQVQQELCA